MAKTRQRTRAVHARGSLALGTCGLLAAGVFVPSQAIAACSGDAEIDATLPSGARWELCWQDAAAQGVVLEDVYFTTATGVRRKVLGELGLAQAYFAADDGSERTELLGDAGLGGSALEALSSSDCGGGSLRNSAGVPVLCQRTRPRGYAWKYYGQQRQGDLLELHSVSRVGGRSLTTRWRLHDDGVIEPAVGISHELGSVGADARYGWDLGSGAIALSSIVQLYWRIDFDIGGNGANDIVEEFTFTPASSRRRKEMTLSQLSTETGRPLDFNLKRSWRVRDSVITNGDGHYVSYHLEPFNHGYDYAGTSTEAWAQFPLYLTRDAACEQLLSENGGVAGCGADITEFVNGESIDGADIVMWYGISGHHLPRAEDDPFQSTRWHGFTLVPRDWTATNPLALIALPGARS